MKNTTAMSQPIANSAKTPGPNTTWTAFCVDVFAGKFNLVII